MNTVVIIVLVGLPILSTTLAWFHYKVGEISGKYPRNTRHASLSVFLGFLAGLFCDAFVLVAFFDELSRL
jgi:hypothetical protein